MTIDEIKKLIEETRDELNQLVITKEFENYYVASKKLDALIEQYLDAQAIAII